MIEDDLQARFAVLTDGRPEPADPAPAVRLRIKRRQRRRRGSAAVLVTAAAVALSLAAGPALGALRSGTASDTGGFAAAPAPLSASSQNATTNNKALPPPWSDKKFTKMPEANAYRPAAYYVAEGSIPTEKWAVLSTRESCLAAEEGQAVSFGHPVFCFTDWADGRKVDHKVVQGHVKEKNSPEIDHTLVMGATSTAARKVRITAHGKTYFADAVGTPTTDRLRFFALVINRRNLKITSIVPVDAAGRPVAAPTNPPTKHPCDEACTPLTPAK